MEAGGAVRAEPPFVARTVLRRCDSGASHALSRTSGAYRTRLAEASDEGAVWARGACYAPVDVGDRAPFADLRDRDYPPIDRKKKSDTRPKTNDAQRDDVVEKRSVLAAAAGGG